MRTLFYIFVISIFAAGFVVLGLNLGCSSDDSSTDSGSGGNTGMTVGPDGGTVTDEGVTLVFPAGALDNSITVTVDYHEDQWDLPDSMASSHCGELGAVTFGPEGQTFNSPVSMTMPINQSTAPGTALALWIWNDSAQAWEDTQDTAIVNADGLSVTAPIRHFSSYSTATGFDLGGHFNNVSPVNTMTIMMAFNSWISWMSGWRHVDMKKQFVDCCTRVTGIEYHFVYQSPSNSYPRTYSEGDLEDYDYRESYQSSDGAFGSGYYVSVTIDVYWTNQAPDEVDVRTDNDWFDITGGVTYQAAITGRSICGEKLMVNIPFDFDLYGPGNLSVEHANTGATGIATTTYTTSDTGQVTIEGEAKTCLARGGLQIATGGAQIHVVACKEWYLAVTITFTHTCENWGFIDQVDMLVPLTIEENDYVTCATGEGSQIAVMGSSNEHCEVSSSSTPDFTVYAQGNIVGQTLYITIAPIGFSAEFTMTCTYDDHTSDYDIPAYTYLLPSIIAGQAFSEYPIILEPGASFSGSGHDTTDDENPIAYEFTVMVGCTTN